MVGADKESISDSVGEQSNYNCVSESMMLSSSENKVIVLCREKNSAIEDGNKSIRENNYVSSLWLALTNNLKKHNTEELKQASVGEMLPSEIFEDLINPTWRRISLRKTKKRAWELLDEPSTELLENIARDQDAGLTAEWGACCRRLVGRSVGDAVKECSSEHRKGSIVGGQGLRRCDCTTTCNTKRCKCKKANCFCNSRCHEGNKICCNDDH